MSARGRICRVRSEGAAIVASFGVGEGRPEKKPAAVVG